MLAQRMYVGLMELLVQVVGVSTKIGQRLLIKHVHRDMVHATLGRVVLVIHGQIRVTHVRTTTDHEEIVMDVIIRQGVQLHVLQVLRESGVIKNSAKNPIFL